MSENSPENSRKFPMRHTVWMYIERFQPLAWAFFGTWLANEYLKPNLDLFIPGIFMAFFGGVMLVISQKYMIVLLCGTENLEKILEGLRQSWALKSSISYCRACEFWLAGLIAVSLLLALDLFTWPPLRLFGGFFLFGSISAFFRIRGLFYRVVNMGIK